MNQQKSHLRLIQTGNKPTHTEVPTTRTKPTKLAELLHLRQPEAAPPPELYWTCAVCGIVEPLCLPTGRWIKRSCACQRHEREQRAQHECWLRAFARSACVTVGLGSWSELPMPVVTAVQARTDSG